MNLQECRRVLVHCAQNYPKASCFGLVAATTLTFGTFIVAVTARDERLAYAHNAKLMSLSSLDSDHALSQTEAQLAAMIENARNSTWRQNIENAVDAHERFVLPNRNVDEGREVPKYVQNIDERSRELMEEEEEKKANRNDPKRTRFWG